MSASGYAKAAPVYHERGWAPLPLPKGAKTAPPSGTTGAAGRWPTLDEVVAWSSENPNGNIGLRLPKGVVGIDVDDYANKGGGATLAQLEAEHGKLPPTWTSTSRGLGVSGIRLFRVPEDVVFPGVLGPGIDVIQHHHRYVVAAPSIHPTGEQYAWYNPEGVRGKGPAVADLPALPEAWLSLQLTDDPPPSTPIPGPPRLSIVEGDDSIAERINRDHDWHAVLTADGWTIHKVFHDETHWTRPGKSRDTSAVLHEPDGPLVVFSTDSAIAALQQPWALSKRGDVWSHSLFGYLAATRHGGDRSACAREYRQRLNAEQAWEYTRSTSERAANILDGGEIATPMDDSIWSERWYLEHIRDAARSRMVAPYAVFGCVVARVAAFTPPSTCLPPTIGGRAPLSLYIALHGASGAGKSSPVACASDLIPEVPVGCVGPLGLGSGEGLVEAYMDLVEDTDDQGKKRKVKRQVYRGALFTRDEGQMLAEIGSRKGSTILPVLRTAWSGDDPGQANASIETRRSLRKGNYHIGLISLWQDKAGAALIGDADGGTPQRFIWLPTTDPSFPDVEPEWPGEIDMVWPATIAIGGLAQPNPMGLAQEIRDEIKESRRAIIRGHRKEAPLDAHRRLNKLKLSGVLALLDGRTSIGVDDWRIAEHFMCVSDAVRDMVLDKSRQRLAEQIQTDAKRYALREVVAQDATTQRALERAARAAWKTAERADAAVTRRQIHSGIASRDRQMVTADEAIAEAVRLSWLTPDGDGWVVGKARPA